MSQESATIASSVIAQLAVGTGIPVKGSPDQVCAAARQVMGESIEREMMRVGDLLARHGRPDPAFMRAHRRQLVAESAGRLDEAVAQIQAMGLERVTLQVVGPER